MHFLKKLFVILLAPFFVLLLYAIAISTGFIQIGTNPETVKKILNDSGVYSSAVSGLLNQSKAIESDSGKVALKSKLVKNAAQQTFTPQFIQSNTEDVLDSVYRWLEGTTPQPDFNIDLSVKRIEFADRVAAAVEKRAEKLPPCAAQSSQDSDPITAKCLPAGVTPESAAATVRTNILTGEGFLDHPKITAASVKSEGSKHSVFVGDLKDAPDFYQRVKSAPVGMSVMALLLALAIIFLSSSKRSGIRLIGILLTVTGVILLAFAWSLDRVVTKDDIGKLDLNNHVLQEKVRVVAADIAKAVDKTYWLFGAGYTAAGIAAITGSSFIGRNKKSISKTDDDLEGEGRTPEDRIDLKEPDEATTLNKIEPETEAEPAAKPVAKQPAKPKKPVSRKVKVKNL